MSESPSPDNRQQVEWDEIADAVRDLFDVWVTGSEREWAKRAWDTLKQRGLTAYGDALDQTSVLIRLLTLAMIYREWCWLAREEPCHEGVMLELATGSAGINPFRVAQLMCRDFAARDETSDQYDLLEAALIELINRERPVISRALVEGFGGEVPLHHSLGATTGGNDPDDEAGDSVEDFASGQALGWIMEGMHEL